MKKKIDQFRSQEDLLILHEINMCSSVQSFLKHICTMIRILLHEYCIYEATQETAWQGIVDPSLYQRLMTTQLRMCTNSSPYRSGSVHVHDVLAVLENGNVRERCHVICNILGRRTHLWVFLLENTDRNFLPDIDRHAVFGLLNNHGRFCNGFICKNVKNKTQLTQIYTRAAVDNNGQDQQPIFCVRTARTYTNHRIKMRLSANCVVPELSDREKEILPYKLTSKCNIITTWVTGRMQWEVNDRCEFSRTAKERNEAVVSGISGHTDLLFKSLRPFRINSKKYITALCAAVWLVGCDHHSIFEIRYTAAFHGVSIMTQKNSLTWIRDILNWVNLNHYSSTNNNVYDRNCWIWQLPQSIRTISL